MCIAHGEGYKLTTSLKELVEKVEEERGRLATTLDW
jgi:hypothetical protein